PLQRQQGQQGPLLGAPDRHRHALLHHFELAEKPHLHGPTVRPFAPPAPEQLHGSAGHATSVPPHAPSAGFHPRPSTARKETTSKALRGYRAGPGFDPVTSEGNESLRGTGAGGQV